MTDAPVAGAKKRRTNQIVIANPIDELRRFLSDIHIMKDFVSETGLAIPEEVRDDLAAVTDVEAAVLQIPEGTTPTVLPGGIKLPVAMKLALATHAGLSKLVSPATPDSLDYTRPPKDLVDFYTRQRTLFLLVLASVVAILGYIAVLVFTTYYSEDAVRVDRVAEMVRALDAKLVEVDDLSRNAATPNEAIVAVVAESKQRSNAILAQSETLPPEARPVWPGVHLGEYLDTMTGNVLETPARVAEARQLLNQYSHELGRIPTGRDWCKATLQHLQNFFAAMLGAAFYTLYTANTYIVQRTFNRAYIIHYGVRFVLGIVAGVILANFGEYLLTGSVAGGVERPSVILTQTVLALMGGYSADAVNAIFTRVAETLTTLVRGDPGKQAKRAAEAEVKVAKASAKATTAVSQNEQLQQLQALYAEAVKSGAPQAVIDGLQTAIEDLSAKLTRA
jgi:hypothetical protein